ncbi:hypothetical protein NL30_32330 [Burkholderia contaminans]|nr:hypothetical protein NL30_32330 [Burkholderia contaminans]
MPRHDAPGDGRGVMKGRTPLKSADALADRPGSVQLGLPKQRHHCLFAHPRDAVVRPDRIA